MGVETAAGAATAERGAMAVVAVGVAPTMQGPAAVTEGMAVMVVMVSTVVVAAMEEKVEMAGPAASVVTPPGEASRFSPARSR